jgi:spermidine/putrescine transport system permease protein
MVASRLRSPIGNPWVGLLPAGLLMLGFFVLPIIQVIGLSVFEAPETAEAARSIGLGNYVEFFTNARYTDALLRSILLALLVVIFSTLIAYPLAYFLVFIAKAKRRALFLFLLIAPFWTSFTIRAFSWQLVLSDNGLIAYGVKLLTGLPVALGVLYTMAASVFGLTLFGSMLTTLMLFSVMITIDRRLIEASRALGAGPWATFIEVILPLSLPGWAVGAALTFIISVGDYAVPTLLGGGFKPVLAQLMLSVVKGTYDLSMAATFAVVLMVLVVLGALPLLLLVRRGVRLQG